MQKKKARTISKFIKFLIRKGEGVESSSIPITLNPSFNYLALTSIVYIIPKSAGGGGAQLLLSFII